MINERICQIAAKVNRLYFNLLHFDRQILELHRWHSNYSAECEVRGRLLSIFQFLLKYLERMRTLSSLFRCDD